MKAVRIHEFGGPETLKYEDVQLPAPPAGEVLVHAYASGISSGKLLSRPSFFTAARAHWCSPPRRIPLPLDRNRRVRLLVSGYQLAGCNRIATSLRETRYQMSVRYPR